MTTHIGDSTWSSLPHSFELNPEKGFEEIFFYILDGENKRAIQCGKGMWADGSDIDEVWRVEDKEFSSIPMGYHPVVGEPGTKVRYIWIYICEHRRWEKVNF